MVLSSSADGSHLKMTLIPRISCTIPAPFDETFPPLCYRNLPNLITDAFLLPLCIQIFSTLSWEFADHRFTVLIPEIEKYPGVLLLELSQSANTRHPSASPSLRPWLVTA
jgi:hypothetical protein